MKKVKINISEERRGYGLESIGNIVKPIVKDMFSSDDLLFSELIGNWADVVGSEISSFSTPQKIKYNLKESARILYIEVPVGGFALELKHREAFLLNKINSYLGYNAINILKIEQNANKCLQNKVFIKKEVVSLTKEEKNIISEVVEDIKDDKLKEILIKLGNNVIISNRE